MGGQGADGFDAVRRSPGNVEKVALLQHDDVRPDVGEIGAVKVQSFPRYGIEPRVEGPLLGAGDLQDEDLVGVCVQVETEFVGGRNEGGGTTGAPQLLLETVAEPPDLGEPVVDRVEHDRGAVFE